MVSDYGYVDGWTWMFSSNLRKCPGKGQQGSFLALHPAILSTDQTRMQCLQVVLRTIQSLDVLEKDFQTLYLTLKPERICYHIQPFSPQALTVDTDKKRMGKEGDQPGGQLGSCTISAAHLQLGQSTWPFLLNFILEYSWLTMLC